jgi:hypothetical protein
VPFENSTVDRAAHRRARPGEGAANRSPGPRAFATFLILAADLLNDRVFPVCDSHEVTLLRVLTGRGGTSYFPPLVRLRAFRRVCRRRTLMRSSRPIHMVMLYNEDLPRCQLFDFILAQAVEPIK